MRALARSVKVGPLSRSAREYRKNGVENADCGWRFARLCMRYMDNLPDGSVRSEMMDGCSGLK